RPLRARPRGLPRLCRLFLEELRPAAGRKTVPRLSAGALEQIVAHAWPGNVRELRNAIERALLLAPGDEIGPEHLPAATPVVAPVDERSRIVAALEACAGNQSR